MNLALFAFMLTVVAMAATFFLLLKFGAGFIETIVILVIVGGLGLVIYSVPAMKAKEREKPRLEKTQTFTPKQAADRHQALSEAPALLRKWYGENPTEAGLQEAMVRLRAHLKTFGIKGSDRQWVEYAEAKLPVQYWNASWQRDERRW